MCTLTETHSRQLTQIKRVENGFSFNVLHLSVQNVSDELLVALQAACLSSVDLNKVTQVQVQLRPAVRDVSNDLGQRKALLGPCCMLVGLIVAVQELDNEEEPTVNRLISNLMQSQGHYLLFFFD